MCCCRCIPELTVAWSRELSSAAFAASPVIADIDADNQLNVAAVAFSGDIHVIRGSDSEDMRGWPFRLTDTSVHASPLQVCGCVFWPNVIKHDYTRLFGLFYVLVYDLWHGLCMFYDVLSFCLAFSLSSVLCVPVKQQFV